MNVGNFPWNNVEKMFDLDYFIVRYKSCQFATYAREKLHAFQFPDGEILSVQYYDEK
jgi:hypothetical protein